MYGKQGEVTDEERGALKGTQIAKKFVMIPTP